MHKLPALCRALNTRTRAMPGARQRAHAAVPAHTRTCSRLAAPFPSPCPKSLGDLTRPCARGAVARARRTTHEASTFDGSTKKSRTPVPSAPRAATGFPSTSNENSTCSITSDDTTSAKWRHPSTHETWISRAHRQDTIYQNMAATFHTSTSRHTQIRAITPPDARSRKSHQTQLMCSDSTLYTSPSACAR